MRALMSFALVLLLAIITPCSAQDTVTFANLDHALSAEQKAELQRFDAVLQRAQAGDLSAQTFLAMRLDREATRAIGRSLWRRIYEQWGFELGDFEYPQSVWFNYQFLAETYMEPEQGRPDPEKGLHLLRELSLRGSTIAANELDYYLRYSPLLPESERLSDAWQAYLAGGERFGTELFESDTEPRPEEVPATETFAACSGLMAQIPAVNELVAQTQAEVLSSPEQADALIDSLYTSIEALDLPASNQRVTLSFGHINVAAVLQLLAGLYEDDSLRFYTPATLPPMHIYVDATDVPRLKIMAELIDLFELRPTCSGHWATVSAPETPASERRKPMLLGLITAISDNANGHGEIHWSSGTSYVGELLDGLPHGEGRYELTNGEISGQFQNGLAHGQADYRLGTGFREYQGQFARGYFNGEGHLIDHYSGYDWKGRFVNHEFIGTGRVSVRASYVDAQEYVDFVGPIENSVAHGKGTCQVAEISYSCAFHQGNLIAVGDVSLMPDTVTGE